MRELPIESINGVLEMVKQTPTAEAIPMPLLLFLRVLPAQEAGSYTLLDSSPLLAGGSSSPQTLGLTDTWRAITQWTLGKLASAIDELDPMATQMYKTTDPVRCAYFLTKGKSHSVMKSPEYKILTARWSRYLLQTIMFIFPPQPDYIWRILSINQCKSLCYRSPDR